MKLAGYSESKEETEYKLNTKATVGVLGFGVRGKISYLKIK